MQIRWPIAAVMLGCVAAAGPSQAKKVKSKGSVAIEARAFTPDGDNATDDFGLGLAARLEAKYRHRPFEEQLRVFARADLLDPTRAIAVVEEGYVGYRKKPVRLRVGYQLLNWTATEAFHPADVMNSRNYDSRIENPDKLGEPMVEARVRFWNGSAAAYYMPFRIAPELPAASSRLSLAPDGVALGRILWAGRDQQITDEFIEHQWALRVAQSIGGADVSLHVLQMQDRTQPTQVLDQSTGRLHPLYHFVTQVGGTYQQVFDAVVLKLEFAHREFGFPDETGDYQLIQREQLDHTQIAFGAEYGWGYESGAEGIVFVEGQAFVVYDDAERAEPDLHPFQRDVLLGYRHMSNDVDSTQFQAGVIIDTEIFPQLLFSASYSQRLTDVWSLGANLRVVHAPPEDTDRPFGLERLHEANELNLTLSRFF